MLTVFCLTVASASSLAQFETRATQALPNEAFVVAPGDFNRDGKLDIAVLNSDGVSILLGNGDGTFGAAVTYRSSLAYTMAVADFNRDGKLDIVVANLNSNPSTVSVYLGNGDGTFQSPIDSNTTDGSYFVAVGDFNNDKIPDLAIIDPPYVSVLLGNGDGSFQSPIDNDSFVEPHALTVGDFNNDHILDLAVVGSFGATSSQYLERSGNSTTSRRSTSFR